MTLLCRLPQPLTCHGCALAGHACEAECCPNGYGSHDFQVLLWQDMRVKPDKTKDLPAEAKETATTVGIWHPVFDHHLAIKHLYFMRQLPADVAATKVSDSAAYSVSNEGLPIAARVQMPSRLSASGALTHQGRCNKDSVQ